VKGHSEVEGSEAADKRAKAAVAIGKIVVKHTVATPAGPSNARHTERTKKREHTREHTE